MNNIFITGSNGFIGNYLIKYLSSKFSFIIYDKTRPLNIQGEVVLHLAGKAHDLKNISNSSEYYEVNTELTKTLFDAFLSSNSKVFITLSSVKALTDEVAGVLTEDYISSPITHYGKSKLLAEQYILSKEIYGVKRVYILRPCMVHGPGNKGNLNLLYKFVTKGIPWPLGLFDNKRSFCSIDNLMFIIEELIEREDIPSGVYNVADDETLSTNDLISILAESQNRKPKIWKVPKCLIQTVSRIGDLLRLPLTTERLQKLTESYVVSNQKIKFAIGKDLPVSVKDGFLKTFNSFHNNAQ